MENPTEVLVSNFGSFVGKKSERLVLKEKSKTIREVPFHQLEQVIIDTPGATISTDLVKECMVRGINISFLSPTGRPYATLISPYLTGTVITRRAQYQSYDDIRGIQIVKHFIDGKIRNQINLLKYFAKYRKSVDSELFAQITTLTQKIEEICEQLKVLKGNSIEQVRGQIMSVEGRAGNYYWQGVKLLTSAKLNFPGREHAGATDPVNSLLNYGYAILYQRIETALLLAGLDPYAGFLHVDRSGKESLVYDFVEEFRQPVVDRVIIAMINKGISIQMEEGRLATPTKKELSDRIRERLESQEKFQGKKYRLRTIIQLQARRIATFLRGEAKYKPFVSSW